MNKTIALKKSIALSALSALALAGSLALAAESGEEGFVPLFNGKDLTGWRLRHADAHNSWSVLPGGILKNTVTEGSHGVDLVTTKKFWNFTARYEYMTPKDSNSGFYLRGRHEIQILGDYDSHDTGDTSNGSIYGFKGPDKFATKPSGEWQTVEATIIGNRITVILNGVKIQDNVECNRATGSEIDGRVKEPGPILLQGDHGTVSFRNIRLKELPKEAAPAQS